LLRDIARPRNAKRRAFLRDALEHLLIMRKIHAYHDRFANPLDSIAVNVLKKP
jgi:hypothetical protein